MDRRDFLKNTAILTAGSALLPENAPAAQPREIILQNPQLAWRIQQDSAAIRSTVFENRLRKTSHPLTDVQELTLVLPGGPRIEIPWWEFRISDELTIPSNSDKAGWQYVHNLAGGQRGRVFGGSAWFRCSVSLPDEAKHQAVSLVLGGYDQQDWNERWVYINGIACGHSTSSGRWREPGVYTLRPGEAAHASLQLGPASQNILAVRCQAYDFHFRNLPARAIERYVYHPFLFDQYIAIGNPLLRVSDFELSGIDQKNDTHAIFHLRHPRERISLNAVYQLDGLTRRKWLEIKNEGPSPRQLLDVVLDQFNIAGSLTDGAQGEPVFLRDHAFFAIEHPAGINQSQDNRVKLWHCPGRVLHPGKTLQSATSVVAAAEAGQELEQFHRYLQARSPRTAKKHVSIYTSYGINNQWGGCGTLADREVLDCQKVVGSWQSKGVKLDYFTLDTGWPQNDGDLTEFITACFPDGPAQVIQGIHDLHMKFGLWFSVSWGGWANGSYAPIQSSAIPDAGPSPASPGEPPVALYRNGYPVSGGVGRQMCIASEPFFEVFNRAVQHHIATNGARLIKFDSGNYYCNSTSHGHLPGKYSTEAMYDHLIAIARNARNTQPDVFVTWYWGAGSPFWALHGDVIAESGLFMEGSGTSWVPTLYYRDAVTVSIDQNTEFAKLIPPMNKDSLGIWLSQIRWANFMGRERWREALVMDLGRGNLLFPQFWGDPNLLNDDDIRFLAKMMDLARQYESTLMQPRRTVGDSWNNDPYGYAFFEGARGIAFLHNAHFTARQVTVPWTGRKPRLVSFFPEPAEVITQAVHPVGFDLWMRPFETLMIGIEPDVPLSGTTRRISDANAAALGSSLPLVPTTLAPWMNLLFADATRFDKAGMQQDVQCFTTKLPPLLEGRSVIAIVIALANETGEEYRYKPVVVEIVQVRARLGGRSVQMIPVPDARRFGNTQSAGCSWLVYKLPVPAKASGESLDFAVHAYLPPNVKAQVQAWVTHQWWVESARPEADGYYGDAPS